MQGFYFLWTYVKISQYGDLNILSEVFVVYVYQYSSVV